MLFALRFFSYSCFELLEASKTVPQIVALDKPFSSAFLDGINKMEEQTFLSP